MGIASYGDGTNSHNMEDFAAYSFSIEVAQKKGEEHSSEMSVILTVLTGTTPRRMQ